MLKRRVLSAWLARGRELSPAFDQISIDLYTHFGVQPAKPAFGA
jgi:hypothetical protein